MTITKEELRKACLAKRGRKPTLTREQVKDIREAYVSDPNATVISLAERFGVTPWIINQVTLMNPPYDYEV